MDAALIELNDDVTYDGALAVSDGSSTNQLTGVKSSLQLTLDVMSPLATYSKRGNRTGFTSGMLGGIISHVDLTFWVDANAGPGDSGGPSYELNSSSGEATAAGGVNGAAAALLSDVPQDRSEEEWHQTVYTSYASVEQEFGVEVAPDG